MSDDIKCNIFKPSDFHGKPDYHLPADMRDFICELANDKLDKLIEAAPTVYGDYKNGTITCAFGEVPAQSDTHSAKLLFIEPLVKAEPPTKIKTESQNFWGGSYYRCGDSIFITCKGNILNIPNGVERDGDSINMIKDFKTDILTANFKVKGWSSHVTVETCKHVQHNVWIDNDLVRATCRLCNTELVATWKAEGV